MLQTSINLDPLRPTNLKRPKYISVLKKSPCHYCVRWRGGTASRTVNVLFNNAGYFRDYVMFDDKGVNIEHLWSDTGRGKVKRSQKTRLISTSPTANSTWPALASKPDLLRHRPATYYLSHSAAFHILVNLCNSLGGWSFAGPSLYPLNRNLGGSRADLDSLDGRKISCLLRVQK